MFFEELYSNNPSTAFAVPLPFVMGGHFLHFDFEIFTNTECSTPHQSPLVTASPQGEAFREGVENLPYILGFCFLREGVETLPYVFGF